MIHHLRRFNSFRRQTSDFPFTVLSKMFQKWFKLIRSSISTGLIHLSLCEISANPFSRTVSLVQCIHLIHIYFAWNKKLEVKLRKAVHPQRGCGNHATLNIDNNQSYGDLDTDQEEVSRKD